MTDDLNQVYDDDLESLTSWEKRRARLARMTEEAKVYRLLNRGLAGRFFRVDMDFGSTGIWETPAACHRSMGCNCDYAEFHLPDWLLQRFFFWELWHEQWQPMDDLPEDFDWDSFYAYGRSLAVDLKYYLGPDVSVDYRDEPISQCPAFRAEIQR